MAQLHGARRFNFVMILSFVIPELIFGVAMFFVFTTLFTLRAPGHDRPQTLGLVTWNVSWPAIIVQARLVTIGKQYEEAAADLGATQLQTMRRVMLPLLAPAIFASAVLVFSSVIDDFVIVDLLSSNASNTADVGDHLLAAARRERRARRSTRWARSCWSCRSSSRSLGTSATAS